MKLLPPHDFGSERLTYHRIDDTYKKDWLPFFQDEGSLRYLGLKGNPEELCENWIKKQTGRYEKGNGLLAIREKSSSDLVGMCGALLQEVDGDEVIEIGYHIMPNKRNQGYASEAARAVRRFLFDQDEILEVVSIIHRDNEFSKKTAHRNGMLPSQETTYQNLPVVIYKAKKYMDKVSFGEYLGAGFVLFLLLIFVGYLISLGMEKWA